MLSLRPAVWKRGSPAQSLVSAGEYVLKVRVHKLDPEREHQAFRAGHLAAVLRRRGEHGHHVLSLRPVVWERGASTQLLLCSGEDGPGLGMRKLDPKRAQQAFRAGHLTRG